MAFSKNSRYSALPTVQVTTAEGRTVKAVKLRRPPELAGETVTVEENDRLDLLANTRYQRPTRFWHIADANTEAEAGDLVSEPGREIQVPGT